MFNASLNVVIIRSIYFRIIAVFAAVMCLYAGVSGGTYGSDATREFSGDAPAGVSETALGGDSCSWRP